MATNNNKEITCIDCGLPSFKGLPPFISVRRLVDGEIRKGVLRHYTCPDNAEELKTQIDVIRAGWEQARRDARKPENILKAARMLEHAPAGTYRPRRRYAHQ